MACPEDGCNKVFASFSRFNSHVQKKHASCSDLSSLPHSESFDFNDTEMMVKIKKEESKFTLTCPESDKKPMVSSIPSLRQHSQKRHDLTSSLSTTSSKIDTDPYHHQPAKRAPSLRNNFQTSAISLEPEQTNDINPSTSFQPQYTEAQFNYTSSTDSTLTTETVSTSNPSDILSLLHQSFFTIDDSEASLKLLSYLATQGNLQIFDQDNQPALPPQHADFIEQEKEQHQPMNATTTTPGFDESASATYPDFSLFSNNVPTALDSAQPQNTHLSLNQSHQLSSFENQNIQQTSATSPFVVAAVNRPSNVLSNLLDNNQTLTNNTFNSFFLNQGQPPQQQQQHSQQPQQHQQQPPQQRHLQPQQRHLQPHQSIFARPDESLHLLTNVRNSHQSIPSNISEMTQQYNINTQEITKHDTEQANYLHNPAAQTMMFDANNLHYQ